MSAQSGATDTSNFDQEFTREQPTLTPVHSTLTSQHQQEFQGFSWVGLPLYSVSLSNHVTCHIGRSLGVNSVCPVVKTVSTPFSDCRLLPVYPSSDCARLRLT
jgi:hypothetical protein